MKDINRFFTDDLIAYTSALNKPQKVSIATKSAPDTVLVGGFQKDLDYPTEEHQDTQPRILSHARESAFIPTKAVKKKLVKDSEESHNNVMKFRDAPSIESNTTPKNDKFFTTPSIDSNKNKNDPNILRSNHLNIPIDDIDVPTLLFDVPRELPSFPHDRTEGHFDDFFLTVPHDSENESEVEQDDRVHQGFPPPLTFQGKKRIFLMPRFGR